MKQAWFRLTVRYLVGILLFMGGAFLCAAEAFFTSAFLFLVLAAAECVLIYSESRKLFDLRILLTLSWIGGIGLSALKLSALSSPFEGATWVVLGGFYFSFLFAYDLVSFLAGWKKKKDGFSDAEKESDGAVSAERTTDGNPRMVFIAILIVAGLSFAGLLAEAVKFGFQFPIFVTGTPHAYTEFHISGVHYFVVSSVLVPALTVYYLFLERPEKWKKGALIAVNLFSLAVPVLLLSKFHLALFFVLPFFTFLVMQKKISRRKLILAVLGIAVVSAAVFVLIVSRREYPEGYLQSIFQFKNESTPVAIQYPYMYITNNYENLNLLVRSGDGLTFGLRQLFPALALTGLKFHPAVAGIIVFPPHTTIEELTTVTLIYDAFGDFGSVGVVLLGMILGMAAWFLTARLRKQKRVFTVLLYAELAVYFGLSFFTTWFSHPTTWFWFIATLAIGLFCRRKGEKIW